MTLTTTQRNWLIDSYTEALYPENERVYAADMCDTLSETELLNVLDGDLDSSYRIEFFDTFGITLPQNWFTLMTLTERNNILHDLRQRMTYHRRQEEFYRERIQWTKQQYKNLLVGDLYEQMFEPDESTGWN